MFNYIIDISVGTMPIMKSNVISKFAVGGSFIGDLKNIDIVKVELSGFNLYRKKNYVLLLFSKFIYEIEPNTLQSLSMSGDEFSFWTICILFFTILDDKSLPSIATDRIYTGLILGLAGVSYATVKLTNKYKIRHFTLITSFIKYVLDYKLN